MRKTLFVIIALLMAGAVPVSQSTGELLEPLSANWQTAAQDSVGQADEGGPFGSVRFVTLICSFPSDAPIGNQTIQQVTELYTGTSEASLPTFFSAISYGQMNLNGSTLAGTFSLPKAENLYGGDIFEIADDCALQAKGTVAFDSFQGINFLVNGNSFPATSGPSLTLPSLAPEVTKSFRGSVVPAAQWISAQKAAREMALTFGLTGDSAGPANNPQTSAANPSPWEFVTGNTPGCTATDPTYGCLPQGMLAIDLAQNTGWLADVYEEVVTIGTGREIQVTKLNGVATAVDRYIKIPVDSDNNPNRFYTVEVRKEEGYDRNLAGSGVIIHEFVGNRVGAAALQLVDSDAGNIVLTDAGAIWTVGETFSTSVNTSEGVKTISIEVLSTDNGDTFDIYVSNQTDVPRPPTVTGLVANAGASTETTVSFDWNDVEGEQNYSIYRFDLQPDGGRQWTQRVANLTAGTTTYQDSGLVCGTTYQYQVRSRNQGVESLWSNALSVSTTKCPGDTNGDGFITPVDLVFVLNYLGTTNEDADVNRDDIVNQADIDLVINALNEQEN